MQINVLDYFDKGALRQCPDATAISSDSTPACTFRELNEQARRIASQILARTDSRNAPIVVFMPKNAQTVAANLGIILSGNIYSNLDVKSPVERLKKIVEQLRPALIITSTALARAASELQAGSNCILTIEDALDSTRLIDDAAIADRKQRSIDTDPLCIINTSGSTGVPKSVVMCHRSVIDFMDWCFDQPQMPGGDVIGSLSPFYFDIYTLELWYCLARGCALDIIPDQYASFPAKLVEYLSRRKISFIFWVPTIMVNISSMDLLGQHELSALRTVFFAGEVFPTKHLNNWRRHLPGTTFMNLYGPIEITVDCTYFVVDRPFEDNEQLPIGFPCRNSDVLILAQDNRPAGTDERGELCVRGTSLAMGYWNDPERTAKVFVQNPLHANYPEVIYRTGDLVYRNERGEIMFVGRRDHQIKHLGYRIELGEIETAALSIHELTNACAFYNAERREISLAYESPAALPPASIRTRLALSLPKYMLPTAFHWLEHMPRNPNGKIDRLALAVMHSEAAR